MSWQKQYEVDRIKPDQLNLSERNSTYRETTGCREKQERFGRFYIVQRARVVSFDISLVQNLAYQHIPHIGFCDRPARLLP
jgi:hypothetical protein